MKYLIDSRAQEKAAVLNVTQLNRSVRLLIENEFPAVWVQGELSNFARPSSGHFYFTLKDAESQIRCAMFRTHNSHLDFTPVDGLQVLVRAKVSLYEGRGDYQLIVSHMEAAGDGALRRAFELLQKKLLAEGLFGEQHKKPLPTMPKSIGVVTSPTGAAIRDILSVHQRRFPLIPIVIYPCEVQGKNAAEQIVKAIATANQRAECDVLIVARGGGSLEDLWSFNEEIVARSIFESRIPIVTGVGHEVDFTIADFVADVRAPTPSAAAERVVPDQQAIAATLDQLMRQLCHLQMKSLTWFEHQLVHLGKRLQHPQRRLEQQAQAIDLFESRLCAALKQNLHCYESFVSQLSTQFAQFNPSFQIEKLLGEISAQSKALQQAQLRVLDQKQAQLENLMRAIDGVSPLKTLDRGYAIVRDQKTEVIRDVNQLAIGNHVSVCVAKGEFTATVTKIET